MCTIRKSMPAFRWSVGASLIFVAPPAAWAGPKLPDNRAGRVATAFFDAFNSGDDEKMKAFESQYRAQSALKERPIGERIAAFHRLRADFGDLALDGVFDSTDLSLSLGAVSTAGDEFLRMQFELEDSPPNGLLAIRIERGGPRPIVASESPKALDADLRKDTIQRLAKLLKAYYVFPDVGAAMADLLRKNLSEGVYDAIADARALADRLTTDLRAICNDKHLRVRADAGPASSPGGPDQDDAPWRL